MTESTATEPRWYWEDFPVGQVREFGAYPVTREAIVAFAAQFDPQFFHLDEEAARQSVLGGLCASGWHTASIAMRLLCEGYLLDAASEGSPGIDELRWLRPVRPGDTLRVRMEVLHARPMASRPRVGLLHSEVRVLNQADEAVLAMKSWGMFRRRHAPDAGTPAPDNAGDRT